MKKFAVMFACLLVLAAAQYAQAEWVIETVADSGDQGRYASIALDSENQPHAAWYDSSLGNLMYSTRTFEGWATPTIVATGSTGKYASIAIDPITDMPAIAFMDESRGDYDEAMYAYYDGTWSVEQIVWDDDRNEGRYIDLAFASDGTPYVSYHYNNGAAHTYGLNVVWQTTDATWTGKRVESRVWGFGEYGKHSAIAMSSVNQPQVIYRDSLNQIPRFSWRDGSGWHSENIVGILSDYCGEYNDIALDSVDNIWTSTFDPTTLGDNCVGVMWKTNGDWDKTEPECGDGGDFGKYTSIAIDSSGNPHVTYYADGELHYAVKDKADWEIETLDDEGDTGQFTSIALDDADNPYIVYYNVTHNDMMFVWDMVEPTVIEIDPDSGRNDELIEDADVTGAMFTPDSTVRLFYADREVAIDGTNVDVTSATALTADFDLDGAWPGMWNVEVTNPAGTGALENGFEIETDPPELDSANPASGANDQSALDVTISGANFADSLSVWLEGDGKNNISADKVVVNSLSSAKATFNLLDAPSGLYDVAISTDYGNDALADGFEITCGAPIAELDATPLTGGTPLSVQFVDMSTDYMTCEINAWQWDFGDGGTSAEQNPVYVFETPGVYTISLTVISPGGTNSITKDAFINVTGGGGDHNDDDDDGDDDDDDGGCCG